MVSSVYDYEMDAYEYAFLTGDSVEQLEAHIGNDIYYVPAVFEDTLDGVREEIDTNLWLAEAYREQKADGLAKECAQAAYDLWRQYHDLLNTGIGKRAKAAAIFHKCVPASAYPN